MFTSTINATSKNVEAAYSFSHSNAVDQSPNILSVATVWVLSILSAQKRDAALVLKTLSAGSAVQDLTNIVNVALPQEIQKNSRMRDFQNRFVMKWLGISTYTTVFFNQ